MEMERRAYRISCRYEELTMTIGRTVLRSSQDMLLLLGRSSLTHHPLCICPSTIKEGKGMEGQYDDGRKLLQTIIGTYQTGEMRDRPLNPSFGLFRLDELLHLLLIFGTES